jgi:hypothetical protein
MATNNITTLSIPATTVGNIANSSTLYVNGNTNYHSTIATFNNSDSALQVSGDANISGNLTVNGVDVGNTLLAIQDRLAILVPDTKKLEQFAALKEAYEHYKMLEALCK